MMKVAQSRQRRLDHYLDPKNVPLATEDEIDAEDCRTALFGQDADDLTLLKEEEMNKERFNSGIMPRKSNVYEGRRNANISKRHLPQLTRR